MRYQEEDTRNLEEAVIIVAASTAIEKQSLASSKWQTYVPVVIANTWWLLLLLIAFVLRRIFFANADLAEIYASKLRPVLMWPLTAVSNLLPISFSFFFVIGVALLGLTILIRLMLTKKQAKGERLIYVFRHIRFVAGVLSLVFLSYMLFHGLNFARYSLTDHLGYQLSHYSTNELFNLAMWLRAEASEAREELQEDAAGRYAYPEGETTASLLGIAYDGYAALDGEMGRFAGQYVRPKIVPLSHYWSYTGTAGMFFPFSGEANVNTDLRPDEVLAAALHEIAHTKGVAREDEANFMAFYTGIKHPSVDYQYAAWLLGLINTSNQLYRNDNDLWNDLWTDMPDSIRRDISARQVYWSAFGGPAQEIAQQVNNNFLIANGEDDGIKGYGRMVDLVLAYYEHEVIDANHLTP